MQSDISNIIIQWGTYTTSYDRLVYTTITLTMAYTNLDYYVGICPKDDDKEAVRDLETSGSCIRKVSLTQFDGKVYGLTQSDTPYGFTWLAIGY